MSARKQAESMWSQVGVSVYSAHDHGQERGMRGYVGHGLLGIPLLSGLFWLGGWYVLGHSKMPSSMPQESVIRNKHNGVLVRS